tara:strand:- start:268 stop:777 length:510 start_codon:yes stop_codon:yes gene_type:complete
MSKTLWISAGPSCIGKSYLQNQRKDIVSRLTNIDTFDNLIDVDTTEEVISILSKDDKSFLLHLDIGLIPIDAWDDTMRYHPFWMQYLRESKIEKKVVVLGLSYSDYKERLEKRKRINTRYELNKNLLLVLYNNFINELENENIPYILVEAKDNYRTLNKSEFFKKITDE